MGPRLGQDTVHGPSDAEETRFNAVENFIDLVDSVRFIPSTLVRQRLRQIRLVFREILLKNFRKIVRILASIPGMRFNPATRLSQPSRVWVTLDYDLKP